MVNYILILGAIVFIIILAVILKSTSFPARIKKAEEYLEEGSISKANEIVKRILDKKKDYVPARYLRAIILIKQNQYLLAISELNAVLSLPDFSSSVNEIDIHEPYRYFHAARHFVLQRL
jgi:tetratricopeptide (TPR) repeat protein